MKPKHPDTRTYLAFALIGLIALSPPQKERTYTLTLPASQMDAALQLINGQKGRVSVAQKEALDQSIAEQIGAQNEAYRKADSLAAAKQRPVKDTTKIKRP